MSFSTQKIIAAYGVFGIHPKPVAQFITGETVEARIVLVQFVPEMGSTFFIPAVQLITTVATLAYTSVLW